MKLQHATRRGTCKTCKETYSKQNLLWVSERGKMHFKCYTPRENFLTQEFFDNVSTLRLKDQAAVYKCFTNLEEKIAQIEELIDNEEAEHKERMDVDEEYYEIDEEQHDEAETDRLEDEFEEEDVSEIIGESAKLSGHKRLVTGNDIKSLSVCQDLKRCKRSNSYRDNSKPQGGKFSYDELSLKELKDICRTRKLSDKECLYALARMGHGDHLVIADAFFPSDSVAANCCVKEVVRVSGKTSDILKDVLQLLPLDIYDPYPVAVMNKCEGDADLKPGVRDFGIPFRGILFYHKGTVDLTPNISKHHPSNNNNNNNNNEPQNWQQQHAYINNNNQQTKRGEKKGEERVCEEKKTVHLSLLFSVSRKTRPRKAHPTKK